MWQKLTRINKGMNGRQDHRLGVDSSLEKFGCQAEERKRAGAEGNVGLEHIGDLRDN